MNRQFTPKEASVFRDKDRDSNKRSRYERSSSRDKDKQQQGREESSFKIGKYQPSGSYTNANRFRKNEESCGGIETSRKKDEKIENLKELNAEAAQQFYGNLNQKLSSNAGSIYPRQENRMSQSNKYEANVSLQLRNDDTGNRKFWPKPPVFHQQPIQNSYGTPFMPPFGVNLEVSTMKPINMHMPYAPPPIAPKPGALPPSAASSSSSLSMMMRMGPNTSLAPTLGGVNNNNFYFPPPGALSSTGILAMPPPPPPPPRNLIPPATATTTTAPQAVKSDNAALQAEAISNEIDRLLSISPLPKNRLTYALQCIDVVICKRLAGNDLYQKATSMITLPDQQPEISGSEGLNNTDASCVALDDFSNGNNLTSSIDDIFASIKQESHAVSSHQSLQGGIGAEVPISMDDLDALFTMIPQNYAIADDTLIADTSAEDMHVHVTDESDLDNIYGDVDLQHAGDGDEDDFGDLYGDIEEAIQSNFDEGPDSEYTSTGHGGVSGDIYDDINTTEGGAGQYNPFDQDDSNEDSIGNINSGEGKVLEDNFTYEVPAPEEIRQLAYGLQNFSTSHFALCTKVTKVLSISSLCSQLFPRLRKLTNFYE